MIQNKETDIIEFDRQLYGSTEWRAEKIVLQETPTIEVRQHITNRRIRISIGGSKKGKNGLAKLEEKPKAAYRSIIAKREGEARVNKKERLLFYFFSSSYS